jgi:hypothetical protein
MPDWRHGRHPAFDWKVLSAAITAGLRQELFFHSQGLIQPYLFS